MRGSRLVIVIALFAAACGGKTKPTTTETGGGGGDDEEDTGPSLADVAPELDALNTEVNSIRDLPVEERDVEVCEGQQGLARMVDDLGDAAPAGLDGGAWDGTVDDMRASLRDIKAACPDDVDGLDAAFTQLLDALDGLVEATQEHATGPAA